MGFSGGGSNVLKPHTHDGTVSQDGGSLNANNITQMGMNAGDVMYSDGNHLQILSYPGVPAGETLTAAAASTAPSWAAGGGAAVELIGTTRLAVAGPTLTVTFPAVSGSDISNISFYWSGLATAGSPYAKVEITFNGLVGNLYKTEWIDQRAGTGTFATDTNTMITPTGGAVTTARLQSGMGTAICGTAQQSAVTDTVLQYFGSISGAAPQFAAWNFKGTYDDAGTTAIDEFTEVKIELNTGNWNIGAQLSVFRNNI